MWMEILSVTRLLELMKVAGDSTSYVISQWHCEKDTEIQDLVLGLILDLEYPLLDAGNTTFLFQQMRTTEFFSWY